MRWHWGWLARWLLALLPVIAACSSQPRFIMLQVVDAATGTPIAGAVVVTAGRVMHTDDKGQLYLQRTPAQLSVRSTGHRRLELPGLEENAPRIVVHLPAITPKALYLSMFGVGDKRLRENALKLLDETELNALVIDVKGDRGYVPFRSGVQRAHEVGAQKIITVRDMPALMATLRARGIYTVARVVTFKDDKLARAHPEWAVRDRDGSLWIDHEGLAWSDPFRQEVWDYNIAIAEEAARLGFDEIQFDYVRLPDEAGLVFAQHRTEKNRIAAISGFLSAARKRLEPYNVPMAADVFGYVLWNPDDTKIGQRLEDLVPELDYISPMLYPTTFQFGIPGYADPVAHPFEVVSLSLHNAQRRTALPAGRFRPWLQAFNDYAFDHRRFGAEQIAAQIRAAEEFGSDGWMLWNPHNVYRADGLLKE